MTLKECFDKADLQHNILINNDNNYELKFSTSLLDVAMIDLKEDNKIELTNENECYSIDYNDSLSNNWEIK